MTETYHRPDLSIDQRLALTTAASRLTEGRWCSSMPTSVTTGSRRPNHQGWRAVSDDVATAGTFYGINQSVGPENPNQDPTGGPDQCGAHSIHHLGWWADRIRTSGQRCLIRRLGVLDVHGRVAPGTSSGAV